MYDQGQGWGTSLYDQKILFNKTADVSGRLRSTGYTDDGGSQSDIFENNLPSKALTGLLYYL